MMSTPTGENVGAHMSGSPSPPPTTTGNVEGGGAQGSLMRVNSHTPECRSGRGAGRERILAAALEILDTQGEAALRFAEIASRADVAVSAITYHFATREGLVAELHAHRFRGLAEDDLAMMKQIATTAATREQLVAGLTSVTAAVVAAGRADNRLARIVSIAAIHGRDDLAEDIRHAATQIIDQMTEIVVIAQSNGLFDPSVDARAFATFVQAYALGMIQTDLDEHPVSAEALTEVILRAADSFFTHP